MNRLLPILFAFALGVPAFADEAPELTWHTDITKAKEAAAKEKKDLFILFTGSDWCVWCKRLEGEVFSQPEFVSKVDGRFVYLMLDFPDSPEAKAKVVDPKASEKMRADYGVQGFPSVVLTTPTGLPFAMTGYQPGGPTAYLAHLDELGKSSAAVNAMIKSEKPDAAVYAKAIKGLAKYEVLGFPGYAPYLAKARELDPEGKHGMLPLILGAEEKKGLLALVEKTLDPAQQPTKEQWNTIYVYLEKSKHLSGMEFCGLGFQCAAMLMDTGRHAEAKALFERISKDSMLSGNKEALELIQGKIKECEAEISKKEAPKPAPAPSGDGG